MQASRPALLVLATAAVLAAAGGAAAGVSALVAGKARELLPNLVELPPADLAVARAAGGKARWEVRFTSTAGNSGEGALVVRATRASAQGAWRVRQVIALAGGPATHEVPLPLALLYVDAPGHDHFHLQGFEHYELAGARGVMARDSKMGYCLGDRVPLGTAGAAKQAYTSFCGRGRPRLLSLVEGISVGWADPYPADLPGQSFALDGLPAGEYTLVNRVNERRLYRETSYADNVAAAVFRLSWPAGPTGKPQVDVLRTCLAERCP